MYKIIGLIIGIIIIIITIIIVLIKEKKYLKLIYKINAGIPYEWQFEIEDENIVEFVKKKVIKNDNKNGKCGGSIYTKYIFKGIKPGTTKIIFKFICISRDNTIENQKITNVKVDEKNNITKI